MASTFNAFDFLTGSNDALSASKKKKNKAKAKSQDPSAAAQNGHSGPSETASQSGVSDVAEGCAILERSAREVRTGEDLVKLFKDWLRMGTEKTKGPRYIDADGTELTFREVLLRSRALELSVEKCLALGLTQQQETALAQLLTAYMPYVQEKHSFAYLISRLSKLLTRDVPDTLGVAQRAVSHALSAVKQVPLRTVEDDSSTLNNWLTTYSTVDKSLTKQNTVLQNFSKSSSGTITREHIASAKQLFKLHQEKFNLLQPRSLPSAKPQAAFSVSEATLKNLEDLKSIINGHLAEALAAESDGDASAQQGAVLAAYRREAVNLAQQETEVLVQIRTLEAQLKTLKAQAAEIQDRRNQIKTRERAAVDAIGAKEGMVGQSALTVAEFEEELMIAAALNSIVDTKAGAGSTPEQVLEVAQSQEGMALELMQSAEQYLELLCSCLLDVPGKANFFRTRISQADKLVRLGAKDNLKQKEDAEKLLAEAVKLASDVATAAEEVAEEVATQYNNLVAFNSHHAATLDRQFGRVSELVARIKANYETVTATLAAPPPAPVSAPPKKTGPQGKGRGATGPSPHASEPVPAAPAAAPAAAEVTVQDLPAPVRVAQQAPVAPLPAAPAPAAGSPAAAKVAAAAAMAAAVAPPPAAAPAAALPASPLAPAPVSHDVQPEVEGASAGPKKVAPAVRQWAKMEGATAAVQAVDSTLPTPAEAFKADANDGFKPSNKKNRKKA